MDTAALLEHLAQFERPSLNLFLKDKHDYWWVYTDHTYSDNREEEAFWLQELSRIDTERTDAFSREAKGLVDKNEGHVYCARQKLEECCRRKDLCWSKIRELRTRGLVYQEAPHSTLFAGRL